MFVRVFRHPNSLLIGHMRNLIEHAGIPCDLRNWTLAGGMGELPPGECEPELWVAEHNVARAQRVLQEAFEEVPAGHAQLWHCHGCGERLAYVFDSCWQCGSERT